MNTKPLIPDAVIGGDFKLEATAQARSDAADTSKAHEVASTEELRKHVTALARALVRDAAALGFIVTIERRPALPLAMGNGYSVIEVREARK